MNDPLIDPVKFLARAEMIGGLLKGAGVPLDTLTARILRGMAEEIDRENSKQKATLSTGGQQTKGGR